MVDYILHHIRRIDQIENIFNNYYHNSHILQLNYLYIFHLHKLYNYWIIHHCKFNNHHYILNIMMMYYYQHNIHPHTDLGMFLLCCYNIMKAGRLSNHINYTLNRMNHINYINYHYLSNLKCRNLSSYQENCNYSMIHYILNKCYLFDNIFPSIMWYMF